VWREDIEEPTEAERRMNLELDHDTKGETGWTDIADSIFRKIENAAVFVGGRDSGREVEQKGKGESDHARS
jgi:hypothetical protein